MNKNSTVLVKLKFQQNRYSDVGHYLTDRRSLPDFLCSSIYFYVASSPNQVTLRDGESMKSCKPSESSWNDFTGLRYDQEHTCSWPPLILLWVFCSSNSVCLWWCVCVADPEAARGGRGEAESSGREGSSAGEGPQRRKR